MLGPPAPWPGQPVARHHYSDGAIRLFLELVLSCAVSQRGAAAVLELLAPCLPGLEKTPCPNAGRLWLLRLGLYELTRPKEQADDWIWIIDQTVQLGPFKALVIVGLRYAAWSPQRGPLTHQDLTLLALVPLERSTGEAVQKHLDQTAEQTGAPRAILSDGGAELQKGMKGFQAEHAQTVLVRDFKHQAAIFLKRRLEADPRWAQFVQSGQRTKLKVMLTGLAFLNPPSLKTKARYMNLQELVGWGRRALAYLDDPPPIPGPTAALGQVETKLGWLRQYREALKEWSEWLAVTGASEEYIRQEGYHAGAGRALLERLRPLATCKTARSLAASVVKFVRAQSASARPGEHLLGSSEVLESLFGKYKRLQSTHSHGGMTAMLLSLGAIVSARTPEVIQQALTTVATCRVAQWLRDNLGITIQAQRQAAFRGNKTKIKNANQ